VKHYWAKHYWAKKYFGDTRHTIKRTDEIDDQQTIAQKNKKLSWG